MLKYAFNRKGLSTLAIIGIIAAIVLVVVAIAAVIAVPSFLKYIRDSKSAEASENLKSIGDGALAYFQEEHVSAADPSVVSTEVFPPSKGKVCSAGAEATKSDPSKTEWREEPWKSLRFAISKPYYFRYCYEGSPDQHSFRATAEGDLDGDGKVDSWQCIMGSTNEAKFPTLSPILEGEEACK